MDGGTGTYDNTFSGEVMGSPEPYSELAVIYDRVMDHVDYDEWARYIVKILKREGCQNGRLIELACGTGNLSIELARYGYDLIASDISLSMIRVAARKFKREEMPARLFVASMTDVPLDESYDAVICMYDSINYLTESVDFSRALDSVASVLKPGGLFLFDVCTVKNSELFFSHHLMEENYGELKYERECRYNRSRRIQENHFRIRKQGRLITESHYQKIYYLDEIGEMIRNSPLEEVARYDDMSFRPGIEDSERVHFLCRKP